jgi:hypothetical protein
MKYNGFPLQVTRKLKKKIILKTQKKNTHTNITKEKMGHLHILQSTHSQGHQSN